jgi:hypothetical protein
VISVNVTTDSGILCALLASGVASQIEAGVAQLNSFGDTCCDGCVCKCHTIKSVTVPVSVTNYMIITEIPGCTFTATATYTYVNVTLKGGKCFLMR